RDFRRMARRADAAPVPGDPGDELHLENAGGRSLLGADLGELPPLLPVALCSRPLQDRLACCGRYAELPRPGIPGGLLSRTLSGRPEAAGARAALRALLDELHFAHVRRYLDFGKQRPHQPVSPEDRAPFGAGDASVPPRWGLRGPRL